MRHSHTWRGWLPALVAALASSSLCLAGYPPGAAATQSSATQPAGPVPVCALLADAAGGLRESPLVALLEVKLAERGRLRLVERGEIEKVLREQALQLAFAPEGGGRRRDLGRLLEADVLVILRAMGSKDDRTGLNVVVCETRSGLRLRVETVAWAQNEEEAAETIASTIRRGLDKYSEGIREIWAIPPFVTRDFKHDFDYLQGAYSRLLEQMLMDRPGLAVVELAEARAIADELMLAGDASNVVRSLPLYLLGEYENTVAPDGRTVAFTRSRD